MKKLSVAVLISLASLSSAFAGGTSPSCTLLRGGGADLFTAMEFGIGIGESALFRSGDLFKAQFKEKTWKAYNEAGRELICENSSTTKSLVSSEPSSPSAKSQGPSSSAPANNP